MAGDSALNSNDLLGAVTYPDNGQRRTESFTYDALGEVLTRAERNFNTTLLQPQTHLYTYDVLARLTADAVTVLGDRGDGGVRRLETAYDTGGRPYLFTSYDAPSGGAVVNQVQRSYNGLSQLTAEYQAHGGAVDTGRTPSVQYVYSELGIGPQIYVNHSRPVQMQYPNGRQLNSTYASGLDGRISRLTAVADSSAVLENYAYLGLGTVVKRGHPQPGVDLSYINQPQGSTDGGDQYTGLDRFGRVIDQYWAQAGTASDRFQYMYDRDSNRLTRANVLSTAFSEQYGYDALNRLTSFARGSHNQQWGLDAVGNWKMLTTDGGTPQMRRHNVQNQIYSIDSGLVTPTYDNNGNTTTDETGKGFKYDAWNRLVEADNPAGQPLATYSYDAFGRRITEAANAQVRDLYFSSAWQVVEERLGTNVQIQNVWSAVYVDALVERDRDPTQSGTLSERLYVQQDANFNVTAVVGYDIPSMTWKVQERYVYDPYGKPTVLSATWQAQDPTTYKWVYLHQGGRFDTTSGLYQFCFRDYSPTLGRWIQADPIGYAGGDSNLYGYVCFAPVESGRSRRSG